MRNLKKILALVLAMSMLFSMTAFAGFTDAADIDEDYVEAVTVLNELGVFKGYTDGSFGPKDNLSRAMVAAIIYRIATGDVEDKKADLFAGAANFSDVPADEWYAGYVGYCANAGYVLGCGDGTFNPNGNVSGFEALAMILRAMGYDAQKEFTGLKWTDEIAKVATKAGILDDVKPGVLAGPASRELVAQLLFSAIQADTVRYTPAFGYRTGYKSLGEENFGLTEAYDTEDIWGRPAYAYGYGDDEEIVFPYEAVATYNVKVDDCDIAKDAGLKKNKVIESMWIDGEVSKDFDGTKDDTIDIYSTKKNIGAQGRITEIYVLDDGIRVVEINTYLAQVTKVTAASTDKNGHTKDATATFKVYGVEGSLTIKSEDWAKGDWALVNVNVPNTKDAALKNPVATDYETVGYTTEWTSSTTTIGKTEYNDANKFVLNNNTTTGVKTADGTVWNVFEDQFGNIIGAIEVDSNYLVVERIEWKHAASTIGGGYALADVVLADGTKVESVTVDYVGTKAASNKEDKNGVVASATVSDDYENNTDYYGHIWEYTVDEDGEYTIELHKDLNDNKKVDDLFYDYDETVTIVNGKATIDAKTNDVVATSSTVYLIKAADEYAYDVYIGKNEVPSGTATKMCVMKGTDGYADLVVLDGFVSAGNSFFAYIVNDTIVGNSKTLGPKVKVYKMGETSSTVVYDYAGKVAEAFKATGSGIYKIELNNKGQVEKVSTSYIADLSVDKSFTGTNWVENGLTYVRVMVDAIHEDTSIQTEKYTGLKVNTTKGYEATEDGVWADYNITDETKVILVSKDDLSSAKASIDSADVDDIAEGDIVIVAYDDDEAAYIYILSCGYTAAPVDTYEFKLVKTTMDEDNGAIIELELFKNAKHYDCVSDKVNTLKVVVYNEKGQEVYSTELDSVPVNDEGNLVITSGNTLTGGASYKAKVELDYGIKHTKASITTPVIEAQAVAGTSDAQ